MKNGVNQLRELKRYNNLWNKICIKENFLKAWDNATKGKKKYSEVKLIEKYGVEKYLEKLLREVITEKYEVSKYTVFKRYTGGKEREIFKLPMKDRIVLHALMNIIEPIFRESFIVDTYSSIKGRGLHRGLKRLKKDIRDNDYKYYLKLDIKKCYPSLNKEILKQKLSKKFKDKKVLNLLFKIVDSSEKGVPIGNYTSLYFNNFYFNDFDHWIKEKMKVKGYYRYCDDMVILGNSKKLLHLLFELICLEINKLKVKLKNNYQIYSIKCKGVDFLGYKTRKTHIIIRKGTKRRFIYKVLHMNLNNLNNKDINIIASYWGIMCHADCRNLWYKYIKIKKFNYENLY